MGLDEAADELYGLAPAEFVAARKALAARTRKNGDKALAVEIARLPKPSAGAWAVNGLARKERARLESLVELGSRFRSAEKTRERDAVVELSKERKIALADLTTSAATLADEAGHPLNSGAQDELAQTLRAAIADAGAAAAVLSGRLLSGLSADGVQAVDVDRAVAGSLSAVPEQKPNAALDRRRAAQTAAADAEDSWAESQSAVAALHKRHESLGDSVADLTAQRDRLERELQDAQGALDAAQTEATGLEATIAEATGRERSAHAAATAARKKADRLN